MNAGAVSIGSASIVGLVLLLAPRVAGADVIQCESRNYQYQFCAAPEGVTDARLIEQRSRARCIQGSSWGWDRRGIWVSGGCSGLFDYQGFRPPPGPPPGGYIVSCGSHDYRQEFCPTSVRITGASLVRQNSRTPCIQGQNWGFRPLGIWVNGGCDADFEIRTTYTPGPLPGGPDRVVCESHDYRYHFCPTGRIRDARFVRQISQAGCIHNQSWGTSVQRYLGRSRLFSRVQDHPLAARARRLSR